MLDAFRKHQHSNCLHPTTRRLVLIFASIGSWCTPMAFRSRSTRRHSSRSFSVGRWYLSPQLLSLSNGGITNLGNPTQSMCHMKVWKKGGVLQRPFRRGGPYCSTWNGICYTCFYRAELLNSFVDTTLQRYAEATRHLSRPTCDHLFRNDSHAPASGESTTTRTFKSLEDLQREYGPTVCSQQWDESHTAWPLWTPS